MRTTKFFALAFLTASQTLFAQVYTAPAGYVSIGDTTSGQPAVKANTDVAVSIPVFRSAAFAGQVNSVTATTVTIKGAPAFVVNAWAAAPHVLVIESGSKSGMIVPIMSNTVDTLTVAPGDFSTTGILLNDNITIRPAWTIQSFMAGASSLTGVRLYTFSNTQLNINNSANGIYFYVGGNNWEDGDGEPANNIILYPGEGFIIRTGNTPITNFTVSGDVPTANSYIALGERAGNKRDTFFSYVSPVSEPLGSSGLGITSGDVLYSYNNTTAGVNKSGTPYFYVGGGNWEDGDGESANAFPLEGGKAYVFRRASAAANQTIASKDAQIYMNP
jgi:uncharacterized protein (TIGR02597 family)